MKTSIISPQVNEYTFTIQEFEGPLDLLLQLIERAELDITKISLAQVTDQYLTYIQILGKIDAGAISAFLVVATKLIQMKSEALLPHFMEEEEQEDVGEELVRQLLLYKKFKEVSQLLKNIEEKGLHTYLRIAPPPRMGNQFDASDINLELLISAAREILSRSTEEAPISLVLSPASVTIRSKINAIADTLRERDECTFLDFLSENPTRGEIVATFLAILELFRRHYLKVIQESIFGEIQVKVAIAWNVDRVFELEFGE